MKKETIDLKCLEEDEKLKYEIAEELGLLDKEWNQDGNHCHPKKQAELVA